MKVNCKACYIWNLLILVHNRIHDDEIVCDVKKQPFQRFWLRDEARNNSMYFQKCILFAFINFKK